MEELGERKKKEKKVPPTDVMLCVDRPAPERSSEVTETAQQPHIVYLAEELKTVTIRYPYAIWRNAEKKKKKEEKKSLFVSLLNV